MDKEYNEYFKKYKYRALDYNDWMNYIVKEHKNLSSKILENKIKEQRKQVKNTPLNFNW